MADWFEFAGARSSDFGVIVQDFPPLTTGEERAEFVPIPGRSGSVTITEGDDVYDDIVLSVGCYIRDLDKIDLITAWLRGSGLLVLGNAPDRAYTARCVNQMEFMRLIRGRQYRTFNAVFRCDPRRYVFPEPAAQTFTSSPASITNPGTAAAEPIITVVGSGDVELTVGNSLISIDDLSGPITSVTINCASGNAYSTDLTPTYNMSGRVSVSSPIKLYPGANTILWSGTVTSVTVSRPWRYV